MKILALGAHPDDIEFGCAGTLIHFRDFYEAELVMLVMTQGKKHKTSAAWREDEQRNAADVLQAKCKILDMDDTHLNLHECIEAIEGSLVDLKPTHVFTPFYDDTHQDHRTLAQATVSAMRESTNLLYYECLSTEHMKPNLLQNIDKTISDKCHAILMHESQHHLDLCHKAKVLAEYRAFRLPFDYAEAFTSRNLVVESVS